MTVLSSLVVKLILSPISSNGFPLHLQENWFIVKPPTAAKALSKRVAISVLNSQNRLSLIYWVEPVATVATVETEILSPNSVVWVIVPSLRFSPPSRVIYLPEWYI